MYKTLEPYYASDLFQLHLNPHLQELHIEMLLLTNTVNTRHIPLTLPILKDVLPKVLKSKCFNDDNLPFEIEATATELGHLFEHILLTYLCKYKVALGSQRAVYQGVTDWNWKRDSWGTFHIRINIGLEEEKLLSLALEQSIKLTTSILETQQRMQESQQRSSPAYA